MATISKAQFGAVSRYAKLEISNAEKSLKAEQLNTTELQTILAKLNQYQVRITDLSDKLLMTLEDEEIETEVDKHEKLKSDIIEAIARLEISIASLATKQNGESGAASNVSDSRAPGLGPHSSVKLPKLNIPPFDGDPLKFQEFWDAFESTIHTNEGLSAVEKLNYLKSYLRGNATNPVAGYSLVATNYETVVSVLKQRFGNKELIIYNHLDSLISLPPTGSKVADLQRTTDECERHIRSLVNLGLEEDTFGRVFVPIIMSKLPIGIRISLHKKQMPGHCWTLGELRETLQQEIYAREMGNRSFGATAGSQQETNRYNGNQRHRARMEDTRSKPATAIALTNPSKPRDIGWMRKCPFCEESHYSTDCRKYPDQESRKKVLGNRCFHCLGRSHTAVDCRSKRCCYYCKSDKHHSSLCNKQFGTRSSYKNQIGKTNLLEVQTTAPAIPESQKSQSPAKVTTTVLSNGKRGILQTALANISGSNANLTARILFDNGASNAFITTKAATRIGAKKVGDEVVALAGFQDKKRKSTTYPVYEVNIKLLNRTTKTICAYGTEVITSAIERHPIDLTQNPLLAKVPLADPPVDKEEEVAVDMLLGSDYYYDFIKSERITLQNGIILLDSDLGYIVAGRIEAKQSNATQLLLTRDQYPDSNFELERLWKLEEVGIVDPKESNDDESAVAIFNSTVSFNKSEKRYYVKWPVKEARPDLPTNFKLAYGRLKSLTHKLKADPDFRQRYHNIIMEQQQKKMIELVTESTDNTLIHYMPHHGVLTPKKTTTKLRVVYDASSKASKTSLSLNDCMYRGPIMLHDLCGLLIRFRTKPIAIVSDVEKAFLQIGLQESDRNLVRFLWLKDPNKPVSYENIVHYRFRRVCFGVIASPFLLAAVVTHHLQQLNTAVASDILNNIYVYNLVSGSNTVEEAKQYYQEAKQAFASDSMNIREWYSNCKEFTQHIPSADCGQETITKVLGMNWYLTEDKLSLATESFAYASQTAVTKRTVLRCLAKIFDPCGYFAPITIIGKILLQQLWQKSFQWDDPLPEDLSTAFKTQVAEWKQIPQLKIPRLAVPQSGLDSAQVELHCFCEASTKAYSAVIYLKVTTTEMCTSQLIFAKARVSPLKSQSVPRMELTAVFGGTKLLTFLEKQLSVPVHRKVVWSDSQCTLHWILGKPVSTRFVKNRVTTIKLSENVEFRYVPTNDNPADLPTRGTSYHGLLASTLWWNGPLWLKYDDGQWPEMPAIIGQTLNDPEPTILYKQSAVITEVVSDVNRKTNKCSLIDVTRFSTVGRAIDTAGYVRRFCNQISKQSRATNLWLTATETQEATYLLLREAQQRGSDTFDKNSSRRLNELGAHADTSGIIRCATRIKNSDLPQSTKEPILLPHSDPLTDLIIHDCHARLLHARLKHSLAELRYRYWVPRGRIAVKRVLRQCLLCHRQRGKPYQAPPEPPLPDCRVKEGRAFATVGIDYLGPLTIYPPKSNCHKVWLCLFTCALSRAIHLEVVTTMSAESFLLALRRFIASWGIPEIIITDNAKQFLTASETVNRLWHQMLRTQPVQEFASRQGIVWKFIVELAPWMGGFYERMVGIAKASLKSALQRKHLDLPELQTVVCEVTAVINSRPLLYSEDEVGDHAITPSHLTCRHWSMKPLLVVEGEESYLDKPVTIDRLIASWRRVQNIVEQFWHSWSRQYLTSLRERNHSRRQKGTQVAKIGDVVLVGEKTMPRGRWRIGRIVSLNRGRDGRIRSAIVRLPNAKSLCRSVIMLYPLELGEYSENPICKTLSESSKGEFVVESERALKSSSYTSEQLEPGPDRRRLQRKAAKVANYRIRTLADVESD